MNHTKGNILHQVSSAIITAASGPLKVRRIISRDCYDHLRSPIHKQVADYLVNTGEWMIADLPQTNTSGFASVSTRKG